MKNLWSRSIVVTMLMFCISCCTFQSNLNKEERPYPFYRHTVKLQAPYIVGGDIVLASGFALDAERIITAGHFCVSVVMGQMKGEIDELISLMEAIAWELVSLDKRRLETVAILDFEGRGISQLEAGYQQKKE